MIQYPSPNHEPRAGGQSPVMVVLHGTWTRMIEESLAFLTDANPDREGGRVSCHYVIDKDGSVYQLVDEDRRAWHAGASYWRGIDDVNSASIGIELQNYGMKNVFPDPYTDDQIDSLCVLLQDIVTRYAMDRESIVAHSDVAPLRKDDPGEHFPWRALAARGLVLWPDESTAPPEMVQELLDSDDHLMNAIHGWGYDPSVDPAKARRAFDRHFVPEIFTGGVENTKALRARRLAALWAMKMGL